MNDTSEPASATPSPEYSWEERWDHWVEVERVVNVVSVNKTHALWRRYKECPQLAELSSGKIIDLPCSEKHFSRSVRMSDSHIVVADGSSRLFNLEGKLLRQVDDPNPGYLSDSGWVRVEDNILRSHALSDDSVQWELPKPPGSFVIDGGMMLEWEVVGEGFKSETHIRSRSAKTGKVLFETKVLGRNGQVQGKDGCEVLGLEIDGRGTLRWKGFFFDRRTGEKVVETQEKGLISDMDCDDKTLVYSSWNQLSPSVAVAIDLATGKAARYETDKGQLYNSKVVVWKGRPLVTGLRKANDKGRLEPELSIEAPMGDLLNGSAMAIALDRFVVGARHEQEHLHSENYFPSTITVRDMAADTTLAHVEREGTATQLDIWVRGNRVLIYLAGRLALYELVPKEPTP